MKYSILIASRLLLFIVFVGLCSFTVQAQKNTNSPYSRYGIGLVNQVRSNSNFGSGGIGYAWRPSIYKPQINDSLARSNAKLNDRRTNYINALNPASFSNISLVTFDASVLSHNVQYTSGSQTRQGNNTGINNVTVAFPIGDKIGMGFGIKSLSSVGYDYEINQIVATDISVTNQYEGSGGVNEFFIAYSMELSSKLSVGLSGKYLFGSIEKNKRAIYNGLSSAYFYNSLDRSKISVGSASFDLGVQYIEQLNDKYRLVIGVVASPIDQLNAKQTDLIANYTGSEGLERFKDTVLFKEDSKIKMPFYSTYGGGINIEKLGIWAMELDFTAKTWNGKVATEGIKLANGYQLNLGFEKFNEVSSFGSYFKRMGYRAGFHYNSSLINVNGKDIDEMGLSLGFTLPLRKSFSTLNFGIELGKRGQNSNGLTKEDYIDLHIGITINDKWFIKRKYD